MDAGGGGESGAAPAENTVSDTPAAEAPDTAPPAAGSLSTDGGGGGGVGGPPVRALSSDLDLDEGGSDADVDYDDDDALPTSRERSVSVYASQYDNSDHGWDGDQGAGDGGGGAGVGADEVGGGARRETRWSQVDGGEAQITASEGQDAAEGAEAAPADANEAASGDGDGATAEKVSASPAGALTPFRLGSGSLPKAKVTVVKTKYGIVKTFGEPKPASKASAEPLMPPVGNTGARLKGMRAQLSESGSDAALELAERATRLVMEGDVGKVTHVTSVRKRVIVKDRALILLDTGLVWALRHKDGTLTVKGCLGIGQLTALELPDPTPVGRALLSPCFGVVNGTKGKSTVFVAPSEVARDAWVIAFDAAGAAVQTWAGARVHPAAETPS